MKKAIVFNDAHIESNRFFEMQHDPTAIKLIQKVCKREKPDKIILNGDIAGCSVYSRHDKYDEGNWTEDKKLIKDFLKPLIRTGAEVIWLEGNHEWWYTKHLLKNDPNRYLDNLNEGIAHFDRELGLSEMGVKYLGYEGDQQPTTNLGYLFIFHGERANKHAGATAKNIMADVGSSFMIGHVHRMAMVPRTMGFPGKRETHVGYENGCLCNLDAVFGGRASAFDWQQGFSEVIYEDKAKGFFSVNQRIITKGKFIHNGKLYTS